MEARTRAAIELPPPIKMPSAPPMPESITASIRNCTRISDLRAPIALRVPISPVHPVTVIGMICITPMAMRASRGEGFHIVGIKKLVALGAREQREIGDGERQAAYAEDIGAEIGDFLFDVVVRPVPASSR